MGMDSTGLYLTIDMDGAPEYMIDHVLSMLAEYDVPATVFATHSSPVLHSAGENVETGLHPSIFDLSKSRESICELKEIYPQARCLRSHGLVSSSALLIHAWQSGLSVTSNYLMLGSPPKEPVGMLYGIHEYPVTFMDDIGLLEGMDKARQALAKATAPEAAVRVLAFHFVHIYLNAVCFDQYHQIKGRLADKGLVDGHIQDSAFGVGDMFLSLLKDGELRRRFALFPDKGPSVTHLEEGYPQ